eukprot:6466304-Amphidinium_carterae.3
MIEIMCINATYYAVAHGHSRDDEDEDDDDDMNNMSRRLSGHVGMHMDDYTAMMVSAATSSTIPVPPYMGYILEPVHSSSGGRQQHDPKAIQMDDSVREAGPCEAHPLGGETASRSRPSSSTPPGGDLEVPTEMRLNEKNTPRRGETAQQLSCYTCQEDRIHSRPNLPQLLRL